MVSQKTLLKYVFQLLVFLIPTQLAYHFWPDWAHVLGIRVDYLAPAIYATDILLVLLLILWFAGREKLIYKLRIADYRSGFFLLVLIFVAANIFAARSTEVALLKWFKIGELALFVLFIKKTPEVKSWIVGPLTCSLLFFSLLGIAQTVLKSTVGGPFYLFGERTFNASTPGIAIEHIFGRTFLRAYSTFPHPNAFAGYLIAGNLLLWSLSKKIPVFVYITTAFALIVTFSLGAAFGLLVCFFSAAVLRRIKEIQAFFLPAALIASLLFLVIAKNATTDKASETIARRFNLGIAASRMISENPAFGIGLGNFVVSLPKYLEPEESSWWLQPVHNIFLLVFAETGALGLLLFYLLIHRTADNLRETGHWKLAVLVLSILLTGLVDHYWLTLQQNQLVFSLVLGLSLAKS